MRKYGSYCLDEFFIFFVWIIIPVSSSECNPLYIQLTHNQSIFAVSKK